MRRVISKLSSILIQKLSTFRQRLVDKITPSEPLTQKQINWFVETLRELGLGIFVGVILNLSLNQFTLTNTIGLFITSFSLWYISYKLIHKHYDQKN
jgi:hypothetical protein